MSRSFRVVALCVAQPGDDPLRWDPDDVQRLLRPSPSSVGGALRCTVGDFWHDNSAGLFDLSGSTAVPWLELPVGHPVWRSFARCSADFTAAKVLSAALQHLMDVVAAPGPGSPTVAALRAADAILVVTTAGSPLAWSQHVQVGPGHAVPCAHVPIDVSHTTLAHEVGHLLGLQHSFGLSTDRVGVEYGDPYCIMSARRFGGRTHQVTRSLPDADLLPGAALWQMVGPGLARATAWAHHPDWPQAPSPLVRLLDWPREAQPLTVVHAGVPGPAHGGAEGPRLVAVRVPEGDRWLTLEVRGPLPDGVSGPDWDAAFRLDRVPATGRPADRDPHDAPGVVVHEVDGRARVIYRGTIALPLGGDTDLTLADGDLLLTVRATGYRDGVATLLLDTDPAVRMAWVRAEREPEGAAAGDGCTVVRVLSTGYAEPVFSWWVDGVPRAHRVRLGDPPVFGDGGVEVLWDHLVLHDGWSQTDVEVAVEVHEGAGLHRGARDEGPPLPGRRSRVEVDGGGRQVLVRCTAR